MLHSKETYRKRAREREHVNEQVNMFKIVANFKASLKCLKIGGHENESIRITRGEYDKNL
jgi:hypothetical protein